MPHKSKSHHQTSHKHHRTEQKLSGILSVNTRGVGYLRSIDKNKEDIEIQNNNLNTALHGDMITVSLLPTRGNDRPTGKVVSIEKRAKKVFAGILQSEKGQYFLLPDDKKMYADILISKQSIQNKKAELGQKIIVKIIKWEKNSKGPEGEIVQVLGKAGEHNTEMQSILYEKGFEIGFPDEVEAEAKHLEETEKPIPQTIRV